MPVRDDASGACGGWVRKRSLRRAVAVVVVFLPLRLKVAGMRHLLGWRIGRRVRIGFSYIDADEVVLGDDVFVGHFNVVRNLCRLRIGRTSHVKNFNSLYGARTLAEHGFVSDVEIGANVKFMSHHFVDCAGRLVIGDDVTVGGRSTEIYTHQRNIRDGEPVLEATAVEIGRATYVAARCTLVSCIIPAESVIGAGAVVVGDHREDAADGPVLLAGNPATVRKRYSTG
jgi:acetyltransferase-like isoleucine patch superfamily enzyme